MKREVYWYHRAVEDITLLAARNPRQSTRLLVAIREFGQTSRGDFKKLQGPEEWRLRVGDWRVLFVLRADAAYVSRISDRQDAY
jgi:mRNA-degrading endonuclease RelE of RelBE toxin-antitoxin system